MKTLPPETELLQIPMWLMQTFKQGQISFQTNGAEQLELRLEKNKLDLDFLQEKLLKTLLQLEGEREKEPLLEKLEPLKNLAEKLKQKGFTIAISHKGKKVLTLGSEAHPTISKIITGTNAVEVNNLVELIRLVQ